MSNLDGPNLTIDEHGAARFLGFSESYLRQARMRNEGPAFVRVRRTIRYRVEDLRDFLAAHRVETKQAANHRDTANTAA